MLSTYPNTTIWSASSRNVQRLYPRGALEQAPRLRQRSHRYQMGWKPLRLTVAVSMTALDEG